MRGIAVKDEYEQVFKPQGMGKLDEWTCGGLSQLFNSTTTVLFLPHLVFTPLFVAHLKIEVDIVDSRGTLKITMSKLFADRRLKLSTFSGSRPYSF